MADLDDDDEQHRSDFADEPSDHEQQPPDDSESAYQMDPLPSEFNSYPTEIETAVHSTPTPRAIDISDLEREEAADDASRRLATSENGAFAPGMFANPENNGAPHSPAPVAPTSASTLGGSDPTPAASSYRSNGATATATRPTLDIDVDSIIRDTLADRAGMLKEPNRDNAYLSFLQLLSPEEREKIVTAAYEMDLDRKDPAWLNAWGDARAAIHVNAVLAKVVTIIDDKLARVDEKIAQLREPQTYVVHADAGTVNDDIATLKGMITALKEQIETMPFRSTNDVHRMTDPFVKLAEASSSLIRSIDYLKNSAATSIEEAVENANEMLQRTAFEKHALPADVNKKYHSITIWLVATAIVVGIAIFLQPFILRAVGVH